MPSLSRHADPDGGRPRYVFPFLRYLAELDVSTLDIVEVLVAAMNALEGGKQAKPSGDQTFWNKSMRVVLARVITLLRASDFDFSLKTLMRAMGGLPIKGTKAPFFSLLKTSALQRDSEQVQAAIRYFDEEFRTLEPRTSGSIRAVWSSMAAELEQQPLDQLLDDPGPGQLAVTPSTVLDDRIPVILDLPTLVSPRTGGVFQAVFHQCLKIALHKRKPGGHVVGLVQDEFQASAPTARELTDIMATARSKGVGGIYATQALSNVMAVYGREDARAIFGTPNVLIACRNDDADTKQFVSERSGEEYVDVASKTEDRHGRESSTTWREEKRPIVSEHELSELQRPLATPLAAAGRDVRSSKRRSPPREVRPHGPGVESTTSRRRVLGLRLRSRRLLGRLATATHRRRCSFGEHRPSDVPGRRCRRRRAHFGDGARAVGLGHTIGGSG